MSPGLGLLVFSLPVATAFSFSLHPLCLPGFLTWSWRSKTPNSIINLGKVLFHFWLQLGPSFPENKTISKGNQTPRHGMKLMRWNWRDWTWESCSRLVFLFFGVFGGFLPGFLSVQLGTEEEGLKQSVRVASEPLSGSLHPSLTLRYHISNPGLSWEFTNL